MKVFNASFAEAMARWIIVGFAALLPIFLMPGVFSVQQGKSALLAVVTLGLALLFFFGRLGTRITRLTLSPIIVAGAFLPVAYALSAFFAGFPIASLVSGIGERDTLAGITLFFGLLVFVSVSASAGQRVAEAAYAFCVGAVVLVALQTVRIFVPVFLDALPIQSITAVGSWHDLGIVLGVALLTSLVLFFVTGSRLMRYMVGTTAFLAFLFLIIVNMSDVWYAVAGVAAVTAVLVWLLGERERTRTWALPTLLLVLAVSGLVLGSYGSSLHTRLPEKLRISAVEVRPSWQGTWEVSESALGSSRTLLFGSGPNTFARNWALYKPESVNATVFWNFDFNAGVGVVPTAFLTTGLLGILAWAGLALSYVLVGARVARNRAHVTLFLGLGAGVLLLLIFHILHAPGFALSALLFLFLGLCAALGMNVRGEEPPETTQTRYRVGASIGLTVVCAVVLPAAGASLFALASDAFVDRGVARFNQTGTVADARDAVERALVVWPWNDRAHRALVEIGILELGRLAAEGGGDEAAQRLQATLSLSIAHGLTAVALDENDYQNWLALAQLYRELAGVGVEGAYDAAKNAFLTAQKENPTSPLPLFRLAQLELVAGNRAEALMRLDASLGLKQDFAAAHYLKSQIHAAGGEWEPAIFSAARAVQIAPDDPLGWYNAGTILYLAGAHADARAALSEAVSRRPDYSNALFMLALVEAALNERERALAALEKVRTQNPDNPTVLAAIENVRAGKPPMSGFPE